MRLAYTSLRDVARKKVHTGSNFVTQGIRRAAYDMPGVDRFEVRPMVVIPVTGGGR